ncbi:hypothetical protein B7463_g1956, partial [Scytalidium lignicola]
MTQLEEESLRNWIISMGKRGLPPRPSDVQSMANILIAERGESTSPRPFEKVMEIKAQYGILDEDTYNFDETGFTMGAIATIKVVITTDCLGKPKYLQLDTREWVTVVETISACGVILPPLIIFKGKYMLQGWKDSLPTDWQIEMSKNGWTTNEISLNWLQKTFDPYTTGLVLYNPSRVMDKLHVEVDVALTPPGSSHSNSEASWVPETPHNSIQLQKQYKSIDRMLRQHRSPSTSTRVAFSQLIKGCEMAMHNAIFLAKEVEELRAANESIQKKLKKSRKRVVPEGNSTTQKAPTGVEASTEVQEVVEPGNVTLPSQASQAPTRRPPKCSGCGSTEHKINKCPNVASN